MKKRHEVKQNIHSFLTMLASGDLLFDFPLQRKKGQWTKYEQSILIHSILMDYDIPAIYSVIAPNSTTENMQYMVVDGLQRLSTIEDFKNGLFPLHKDTPTIEVRGTVYTVANKTFTELPEDLQRLFYDYSLLMYYFVSMSKEEMAEMAYRITNGSKHNAQQKSKALLGLENAIRYNEFTKHAFFDVHAELTAAQIKAAADERIISEVLMCLDDGFADHRSFDNKTIANYHLFLQASDNTKLFEKLNQTLNYLVVALSEKNPKEGLTVLKKKYLTHVILLGNYHLNKGTTPDVLGDLLLELNASLDHPLVSPLFSTKTINKRGSGIASIRNSLVQLTTTDLSRPFTLRQE